MKAACATFRRSAPVVRLTSNSASSLSDAIQSESSPATYALPSLSCTSVVDPWKGVVRMKWWRLS